MEIPTETKVLITPVGQHKILVRSYLTGEDRRANRRLILQLMDEGKSGKVEALEAAEDATMKQVIIDIDGDKENIVERVLKMQADDYGFVIDAVNEIVNGLPKKKEETSDGNISHSSATSESS